MQLWIFVKSIFTFNWGNSWATSEAISNMFRTRLPATLTVMIPILILDTVLASSPRCRSPMRGSLTDRSIMIVTTVALSISFLVYMIVGQYLFGFYLGWFPVQGWSDSLVTNLVPTCRCRCCWRCSFRSRRRRGSTAVSSSTRSARTTCAPRVRRA